MRVFLSWAGSRSKGVALLMDRWLRCVIQACDPWISTRDIDSGAIWFNEINEKLSEVSVGVICLTQENLERPWILFEAGALARGLSSQRVITFLIDVTSQQMKDPLAQFNYTIADEEGLRKLTTTINNRMGDRALKPEVLKTLFDTFWPQFQKDFNQILADHPLNQILPPPNKEDLLGEILGTLRHMDKRVRSMEYTLKSPTDSPSPRTIIDTDDLMDFLRQLNSPEHIWLQNTAEALRQTGNLPDPVKLPMRYAPKKLRRKNPFQSHKPESENSPSE